MNLKKKTEDKKRPEFKDMELFKNENEEEENSVNEEPQDDEDEENAAPKFHRLNWQTKTNLYDSAIMVKELNVFT